MQEFYLLSRWKCRNQWMKTSSLKSFLLPCSQRDLLLGRFLYRRRCQCQVEDVQFGKWKKRSRDLVEKLTENLQIWSHHRPMGLRQVDYRSVGIREGCHQCPGRGGEKGSTPHHHHWLQDRAPLSQYQTEVVGSDGQSHSAHANNMDLRS